MKDATNAAAPFVGRANVDGMTFTVHRGLRGIVVTLPLTKAFEDLKTLDFRTPRVVRSAIYRSTYLYTFVGDDGDQNEQDHSEVLHPSRRRGVATTSAQKKKKTRKNRRFKIQLFRNQWFRKWPNSNDPFGPLNGPQVPGVFDVEADTWGDRDIFGSGTESFSTSRLHRSGKSKA